jgi:general secretion pathway protein D
MRAKVAALREESTGADSCRRLPEDKRLKLSLKPNTDLVDLISWISAITCKHFIVPGTIPARSKTVTIISPKPITAAEAYRLFLDALDSVGLTVYPSGKVLRVIETSKVKSAPLPLYIDDQI